MEIKLDLERVLWHEIGHFCIDLIDTKRNENFSINAFNVYYRKIAITDHKWGGEVITIPSIKHDVLVEDIEKTSFSIINLISGCIFQTIFIKEILKNEISINDCFCAKGKCAGEYDCHQVWGINAQIRKKYGRNREFIEFIEVELLDIYYELVLKNTLLVDNIRTLIIFYAKKVFNKYEQSNNQDEFIYNFDSNEIELLKNEIHNILVTTSFENSINELAERIKDKINSLQN